MAGRKRKKKKHGGGEGLSITGSNPHNLELPPFGHFLDFVGSEGSSEPPHNMGQSRATWVEDVFKGGINLAVIGAQKGPDHGKAKTGRIGSYGVNRKQHQYYAVLLPKSAAGKEVDYFIPHSLRRTSDFAEQLRLYSKKYKDSKKYFFLCPSYLRNRVDCRVRPVEGGYIFSFQVNKRQWRKESRGLSYGGDVKKASGEMVKVLQPCRCGSIISHDCFLVAGFGASASVGEYAVAGSVVSHSCGSAIGHVSRDLLGPRGLLFRLEGVLVDQDVKVVDVATFPPVDLGYLEHNPVMSFLPHNFTRLLLHYRECISRGRKLPPFPVERSNRAAPKRVIDSLFKETNAWGAEGFLRLLEWYHSATKDSFPDKVANDTLLSFHSCKLSFPEFTPSEVIPEMWTVHESSYNSVTTLVPEIGCIGFDFGVMYTPGEIADCLSRDLEEGLLEDDRVLRYDFAADNWSPLEPLSLYTSREVFLVSRADFDSDSGD